MYLFQVGLFAIHEPVCEMGAGSLVDWLIRSHKEFV